jgi:hypothetical protein
MLKPASVRLKAFPKWNMSESDSTPIGWSDVRACKHTTLVLHRALGTDCDRNLRIAFLHGTIVEPPRLSFPKIHDVFEDGIAMWTGYPLTKSNTPHRPTLYLRERCRLAELFEELHALVLTKGKPAESMVQGFVAAAEDLLARLRRFYQRLPFELQYRWPMSTAVWELQ